MPQVQRGQDPQSKYGGTVFDFREAFWRQWDRCLALMTVGENLTGAIEALYATARLGGDPRFEAEWDSRPIHGYKDSKGEPVYVPSLQDNLRAFQIIGDLARRKGWAERKRAVSELKDWKKETPSVEPSQASGTGSLEG